jgi:hypothetical protein
MFASNSAPLLLAATVLVAGALVGTQANAAESRMTDAGFIHASRCAGLAQGAGYNTSSFNDVVRRQSGGREQLAWIMADQAREEAAIQAARPGYRHASAVQTLEGACSPLVSQDVARARRAPSEDTSR